MTFTNYDLFTRNEWIANGYRMPPGGFHEILEQARVHLGVLDKPIKIHGVLSPEGEKLDLYLKFGRKKLRLILRVPEYMACMTLALQQGAEEMGEIEPLPIPEELREFFESQGRIQDDDH